MKKDPLKLTVTETDDSIHFLPDGRLRLNVKTLKQLRQKMGFSQSKLADFARDRKLPLSIATIKRAELGEPVIYRTALQYADLFQVELEQLLETHHNYPAIQDIKNYNYDIVGRDAECKQIQLALDSCHQLKRGVLFYIRGIAGIGKTCLFDHSQILAGKNGFRVHRIQIPSPLLKEATRSLLEMMVRTIIYANTNTFDETSCIAWLTDMGLDSGLKSHIMNLAGLPVSESDRQLITSMSFSARKDFQIRAVRTLIETCAKWVPTAFFIDDIHWADENTIADCTTLIDLTRDLPVFWCLTSRYEHDPLEENIRPFLNDYSINILDMAPLSRESAEILAIHALPDSPERRSLCIHQAQGNPLFLTQLLNNENDDIYPPTLLDLIRFKTSSLDPQDEEAISIAAVLQRQFCIEEIRSLLDHETYSPKALVRLCLLKHNSRDSFSFVHDLIMRGIYEQLPEVRRKDLHLKIATHYENIDINLNALHLTKGQSELAPLALVKAIESALQNYLFIEALSLLDIYKEINFSPINLCWFHFKKGIALSAIGDSKASRDHYVIALDLAASIEEKLQIVVKLCSSLNTLDLLYEEKVILEKYIQIAKEHQQDLYLGQLLYLYGNLLFPTGDYRRSRELHLESQKVAQRISDPRTQALALSGLGDSYYAQGHMLDATQHFKQCLDLCEAHGLPDVEAANRFMLATTRIYLNETVLALDDALKSANIGNLVGNRRAEIVSRLTAGWIHTSLGQIDAALTQYENALQSARSMGTARFVPFLLEGVAKCHYLRGDSALARETIREAWSLVEKLEIYRFIGPWVLGTRALIEEEPGLRKQVIETGLKIINKGCVAHNVYRFCVSAAEASLMNHDCLQAAHLAETLENFTREQPCPWSIHFTRLIRLHVDRLSKPSFNGKATILALIRDAENKGLTYLAPTLHSSSD